MDLPYGGVETMTDRTERKLDEAIRSMVTYPLVVSPSLIRSSGTVPYQGWFIGNPNNQRVLTRRGKLPWWVHALAVVGLAQVFPWWPAEHTFPRDGDAQGD